MGKKRRKINSIHYRGAILGSGVVIGGLGLGLSKVAKSECFHQVGIGIGLIGLIFIIGITIWLIIEGFQDYYWNQHDLEERNRKIKIDDQFYECQNCGNRRVQEKDVSCNHCGCQFKE